MSSAFLTHLMKREEQIIALEIENKFSSNTNPLKIFSKEDIGLINENLLLTDETNIAVSVHRMLIDSLIISYIDSKFNDHKDSLKEVFQFIHPIVDYCGDEYNINDIPHVIEALHTNFLNSAFEVKDGKLNRVKSKHHLKESGAVYTLPQITNEIVKTTIANSFSKSNNISDITCLDFACGTGRFYFEALKILNEIYKIPVQDIVCNNLFAVDLDKTAVAILRCKVLSCFDAVNTAIIRALSENLLNRNALISQTIFPDEHENCIDFSNDFNTILNSGGFDVVFSNPPYYLLKVNKKISGENVGSYYSKLQNKILKEIDFFRTSGLYNYSIEGMLNYYQLSIEMILRITKQGGEIGIICPSSIFADLTSARLRKYILEFNKLHFIRYYPEAAKLFENVSQATVIFFLQKGGSTRNIKIEISNNTFEIEFSTIRNVFPANLEIPLIDEIGWNILAKISRHSKLKELSFIRNRRGELDLTLFKGYITSKDTGYRLVRGNMIKGYEITNKNDEYVIIDKFLDKKSNDFKQHDFNRSRLACQQISNIDIQRRLRFVFCKETDILGNSCNYIVSKRNKTDLDKLFYILNSSLLNWRFKITSSNNHINNYELDELPIIDLDTINLSEFSDNEVQNERVVGTLYGLTDEEINYLNTSVKKAERTFKYEYETL